MYFNMDIGGIAYTHPSPLQDAPCASFTAWLRTYGLVPMCCGIVFQVLVTLTACCWET